MSFSSPKGIDNYAFKSWVNRMDKRVEKILEMMRDDVRGELCLAEFAQSVNLSVWRLCHIFKSDVGMPPIKYLRLLRMEKAKTLLESSFLSVKEIAFQVGLNDESHFVRDFKATYGHSPAIYRSQFKRNDNSNGLDQPHSNQPTKLSRQLARVAKQSVLPTLQLFVYVVYCC
jgi:transcriptional regulator GlxA family with amidase domain